MPKFPEKWCQNYRNPQAADPRELLEELRWVRLDFYYRISDGKQVKFLRGWLRRMIHLRESIR